MISADTRALKNAFRQHYKAAIQDSSPSNFLLLFYGVECGLKAIYLKQRGLRSTSELPDANSYGHDLLGLVKELRLSASVVRCNSQFCLSTTNDTFDIRDAHQVWRYGLKMKDDDQIRLVQWLKQICAWIQENI